MIKVEVTETCGPFCGQGGYGTQVGVGLHKRSVAKAVQLAKEAFALHGRRHSGHFGGGVPVLKTFKIWKDGKLVVDRF